MPPNTYIQPLHSAFNNSFVMIAHLTTVLERKYQCCSYPRVYSNVGINSLKVKHNTRNTEWSEIMHASHICSK